MSHHLHEVGVENAAPSWCRCYRGRTAAARALSDMAEFPDWLLQRKDFRAILDSKSEPWLYALRKKPYNRDGKDKKDDSWPNFVAGHGRVDVSGV